MKAAFAFVFALSTALTLATPAPIAEEVSEVIQARENCYIGPPVASVVDRVYKAARARGVNARVMLATFQTAAVESNFNNPRCGDQDSVGVFQARTSQGWGTIDQIMNIEYTTNRFLDVCIPIEKSHPGSTTGQVAQLVQRSEFPDRYDQKIGVAREQLNLAIQRNGGYNTGGSGGSTNVGTTPGTGSGNNSGSGNSGSGSSGSTSGSCTWSVTVAKGQTCGGIASKNGVSVDTIYKLNGSVNKSCSNLQIGQKICLKKSGTSSSNSGNSNSGGGKAAVPGNLASGTTKSCSRYSTVKSGQNCSQLAKTGNISLSSFYLLNGGVNKSCGNLAIGKAYCISA